MQNEYVVMRDFHMGEIVQNLTAGERLTFDGTSMTRLRDGAIYQVSGFSMLTRARLIVEDDGTQDFVSVSNAPKTPRQPTMPVIVEDHDNMIVAKIKLPEKVNGRNRKSTEEVAKTTAETTTPRVIVDEQRVVARAGRDVSPRSAVVDEAEAIKASQDAEVVANTGDRMKTAMDEAMKAEGFGPKVTGGGMKIISDLSEGVVVAKIESLDDRKARLKQDAIKARLKQAATEERKSLAEDSTTETSEDEAAALADDIRLALAKRAGQAPTAASKVRTASLVEGEPDSDGLNKFGYPEGFPHEAHWRKRLDWCKKNSTNKTRLIAVYAKSTESFRTQLEKNFPDVNFK